ncbi:DUF1839 family protein [Cupriavidus metallidurans]|uniref:DUF1839 family protein n=1 Tax=Cupriavidus metallidurans (strain ATCC 43123 / DSM 2839 / NBRC 102507 / CH34) TaxID=266264 RepID=Q1LAX5_CUPMC|nr:DUF1839 family protein [Cupriavidus metallidurans]ABF12701.1 conserved hypothetical protein [Cupriavidus metallidurans CH34]QGS32113.1 DUF1839 family protein [Cupriavidus metallidurans]
MERGTETVLGTLAGCGGGADSAAAIAPANTRPGGLHGEDAIWQETNCYMDLWIELLYGWGLDPRAALAFTVTQDFEGDHFTFFKYPQADIEQLYGTVVQEMAVYDTLEAHVAEQVGRGHTVLVEVDSYYLPDTRATAYRRGHVKTTIAVDRIDTAAQRLSYYHSVGYYTAEGEDYRGLLRLDPALRDNGDVLFPYAECAKRVRTPLQGAALANAVAVQMRRHLGRRPAHNPVSRWREAFGDQVGNVLARGDAYFHHYGFNLPRQLGANFEMLGHCLTWLGEHGYRVPASAIRGAATIASECKVLQFRLARAVARGRPDLCAETLDTLEAAHSEVIDGLLQSFGSIDPAHS